MVFEIFIINTIIKSITNLSYTKSNNISSFNKYNFFYYIYIYLDIKYNKNNIYYL